MRVYVILYEDLRLNNCKVSQKGYKTLREARQFCRQRVGLDVRPDNPAVAVMDPGEDYVFINGITSQKYTIAEVDA